MTQPIELLDQDATDAERFVIAWLTPFVELLSPPGGVDIRRRSGDALPFAIVREAANSEDGQQMTAYPTVSVHWLAATESDCRSFSKDGHRRMLVLARDPLTVVDFGDGESANAQWLETDHAPIWVDYRNDQIFRRVSRYRIALPFTDI